MKFDDGKIKDILQGENYVSAEDLEKGAASARAHRVSLVDALLAENLITKDLLGQAIAESFDVAFLDLSANPPPRDLVTRLPAAMAKQERVVLVAEEHHQVKVATDDPGRSTLKTKLKKLWPRKKLVVVYALPEDIDGILKHYRPPLGKRFLAILQQRQRVAPELIDEIIEDAVTSRASDIHIEPQGQEIVVRFRVDGVLYEAGRIPKRYYEMLLNRIKIEARLRIDEHFAAQDGAIRHEQRDRVIDMRVSIVPTYDGEKVAIRLLTDYVREFTLGRLGLSERHQQQLLEAARQPFGMILVTGPTGSGKTTSLYALMKVLNAPEINITTIEDPIEYQVTGINQIQANPNTNLTFAQGLRSIIRQDPDVVLVGEIRDQETAEIAINAALTGHLLLSTFHANDAATVIPRLIEMGVEPFLVASTLELVIAQRLVRTICRVCRVSQPVNLEAVAELYPQIRRYLRGAKTTLYHGKGCAACNGTGYQGRTGLFEVIAMTPAMEELILRRPTTQMVWQRAVQQGSRSLFEDGIDKVKAGKTTLEELLRVAPPPS
ncbi:MAG: type II/IV secretion system protein [Candidatus Kerfeldbacteria bacterium]|nr:type II/IV secretion system protein [Candidatus Kerfeldbacteria bacterium]